MVRSVQQAEWTDEDRALMLARDIYRKTLCDGCGQPKDKAWHWDNEGYFEVTREITCWGCTAQRNHGHDPTSGPAQPVQYLVLEDLRDYAERPLPPFEVPTDDSA